MGEPEDAEVGQAGEVGDLLQITNVVLSNVDFLELRAVREVLKRGYLVMGERNDFEVWQLAQDCQIVNLK